MPHSVEQVKVKLGLGAFYAIDPQNRSVILQLLTAEVHTGPLHHGKDEVFLHMTAYMLSPVRPSVCLSVCHTGGSYKNG